MDFEKLESLKNKDVHAQSAIASQEVREHLAGFIRSKRLGSSTQINNLQQNSGLGGHQSAAYSGQTSRNGSGTNDNRGTSFINGCSQDDDHPLRKTASMPTMHIPYKAQSLSRRRQMERRTTMSPLMKWKSKLKRQLLHSQDSSSTESSSNPCIIQSSGRNSTRSLSQSNSPPPMTAPIPPLSSSTLASHQQQAHLKHHQPQQQPQSQQQQQQQQHDVAPIGCQQASVSSSTSQQAIKLSSIFTNRELETLQNNLKNSLYFSTTPNSSSTNLHLAQSANLTQNNNGSISSTSSPSSSSIILEKSALKQQHHLKVNEAIRKTVIQRASSKGKMVVVGGSLDRENSPSLSSASRGDWQQGSSHHSGNIRDELRQLSLDGADLRNTMALNRLTASGAPSVGGMFHRDFHKHRLATTNDAASLRRSQSPSSSISMGLSCGQANLISATHCFNATPAQQAQFHQPREARLASLAAHIKHHSSSSSSTSSLLSQQDSLEESSSQAIDLSSSSEASRQQHRGSHQAAPSLFGSSHRATHHLIKTGSSGSQHSPANSAIAASTGQHYQKVLQESFNQLQLCQSQDCIQQLLLTSAPALTHQVAHQGPASGSTMATSHASPLLKTASSPDAGSQQHQQQHASRHPDNVITARTDLSASAQNLISQPTQHDTNNIGVMLMNCQPQQHYQHPDNPPQQMTSTSNLSALMTHDLNQLLGIYNNLIQSSDQQSSQLTSSLLAKLTSLPEPYKSGLLTHLIQQQQQQFSVLNNVVDDRGNLSHQDANDQRSLMSRALSSPLLVSANTDHPDTPMTPVEQQTTQQSAKMSCNPANRQVLDNDMNLTDGYFSDSLVGVRKHSSGINHDRSSGMIVDGVDELSAHEPVRVNISTGRGGVKQTFSVNESNHSLDLTLSSRLCEEEIKSSSSLPEEDVPLNFSYAPLPEQLLPKRASCSFIYNPVFDAHSFTGIVYELEMCNHKCICANESNHPENSYRILAIWRRLFDKGLMARCAKIEGRRATMEELQLCHR